jgi:hypothetical protein
MVDTAQPSSGPNLIANAQNAWAFLQGGKSWAMWVTVGYGLQECRRLALARSHARDTDSGYAKRAMGAILQETGLDAIDKTVRSVLLKCMEHLQGIETWRRCLTTDRLLVLNHPLTNWRAYQATQQPLRPKAEKPTKQAELEHLREHVTEIESDRTTLQQELEAARHKGMDLAGENAKFRTRIAELEAENARLRARLAAIHGQD